MGRPRKDHVATYKFITSDAISIEAAKSHRDCVYFDYFNPNGAYAVFRAAYDRLCEAVDEGLFRAGVLVAYDGDYHIEHLSKLAMRKSNPNRFESRYHGKELLALAVRIDQKIEETRELAANNSSQN